MKVFVYGSLMQGYGNHHRLESASFLGEAITPATFTMLHLGGFPGIVKKGNDSIRGEVYEVDHATSVDLDRLEGHPNFFRRTPIFVRLYAGRVWFTANAYVLPDYWLDEVNVGEGILKVPVFGKPNTIASGDWRKRER